VVLVKNGTKGLLAVGALALAAWAFLGGKKKDAPAGDTALLEQQGVLKYSPQGDPVLTFQDGAYTGMSSGFAEKLKTLTPAQQREVGSYARPSFNAPLSAQRDIRDENPRLIDATAAALKSTDAGALAASTGRNILVRENPNLRAGSKQLAAAISTGNAQISKSGRYTGVVSRESAAQTAARKKRGY